MNAALGHTTPLYPAVSPAIPEVNHHADHQPHHQPDPGDPSQADHQVKRNPNPHDGHKRHQWSPEGAHQIRVAAADDPYAGTHDHKSQQRADADHVRQHVNGQRRRQRSYENAHGQSGDPRSAKSRMDHAEHVGQQSVCGHGKEPPRLPQQHDHDGTAQPHQCADFDHQASPTYSSNVNADRQRIAHVQVFVIDQAAQNTGGQDVQHGADDQRTQNADGHDFGRVLGLLGGGGNGVKTAVREEDDGHTAGSARPSVNTPNASISRNK